MYPQKLQLKNIKGIKNLEFNFGSFNVISGKNGIGKSTIIDAIIYMGEISHNPDMLKTGAKEGEIRLVIGDESGEYEGANFVCKVTPAATSRFLEHPKHGKISVSKSKEWFKTIVNMVSLDPTRFINAKEEDQIRLFLEASPQRVTAEQLSFLPVDLVKNYDLDSHALTVIDQIRTRLYDARKDKNVVAKDKRSTARTIVPEDVSEDNWEEILAAKTAEKQRLYEEAQSRWREITKDAEDAEDSHNKLRDEKIKRLERECSEAIEKIRADTQIAVNIVHEERDKNVRKIIEHKDEALRTARAEYAPKNEALVQEITTAKNMLDAQVKAQSSRELAERLNAEAEKIEAESDAMTEQIKKLDALKLDLLSSVPIPEIEIKDGRLYDNGIPLKSANSAEQFRIMFEVGKLTSGPMGFMVMDNAELLDDENWPALVDAGNKAGMTIMAARRTKGPLAITTEGKEVS